MNKLCSCLFAAEYIDYHLSGPESSTAAPASNLPRFVHPVGYDPDAPSGASGSPSGSENVTAQLGASATLSCLVANLQDKTVSY